MLAFYTKIYVSHLNCFDGEYKDLGAERSQSDIPASHVLTKVLISDKTKWTIQPWNCGETLDGYYEGNQLEKAEYWITPYIIFLQFPRRWF